MKRQKLIAVLMSAALAFTPVINVMAEENAAQVAENDVHETEDTKTAETTEAEKGTVEENSSAEAGESTGATGQVSALTSESNSAGSKSQESVQTYSSESTQQNGTVGGYIPSDLDYNTPVYYGNGISTYNSLPAKYPEADDPIAAVKAKYPANRNQNPYGTCWAFSSLGLGEFDLINDGNADSSIDLSELQLIYFTYNFVTDPLGDTKDDKAKYHLENTSFPYYLNRGGNYEMAARRLSEWVGVTDESTVPYTKVVDAVQNGLDDEYAYNHNVAHLENTYLINIKQNVDEIKKQIMEHGAVGAMYGHHFKGQHSGELNTYFDTANTTVTDKDGGHAVMIVGWDDNFSKDNFSVLNTNGEYESPTEDGAWLIRNSWGPNLFSYFWMSYETKSLLDTETVWVFDFNANDGYDNNYQADAALSASPLVATTYATGQKKVCNVFHVSQKEGVSSETLKAVSLSMTHAADVNYKIEIYTDIPDRGQGYYKPSYGTLQEEATTEGTTQYAGIYTIPLKKEIELKPGTNYAVVVTVDQSAIDQEQASSEGDVDTGTLYWECTAGLGDFNSMYLTEGSQWWQPVRMGGNYCIKAFTCNNKDFGETLEGYTATLNGAIDLNFKMSIAENSELLNDSGAYMEFTVNGNTTKVKVTDATKEGNLYVFPCKVVAKEMTAPVTAQLVSSAGEKGKTYTYSVREYAEQILKSGAYTDDAKNMVKAMLNYGAYAQTYFNYRVDDLANQSLDDSEKVLADCNYLDDKYMYTIENETSTPGISYYGSLLNLNTEINVKDYFLVDESHKIEDYSFTYTIGDSSEKSIEPVETTMNGKTCYLIDIKQIKAQNLAKDVVVTIKSNGNDTGMKLKYGVFQYGNAVARQASGKTDLVNLTKAIYWYWNAADQYINGNNK